MNAIKLICQVIICLFLGFIINAKSGHLSQRCPKSIPAFLPRMLLFTREAMNPSSIGRRRKKRRRRKIDEVLIQLVFDKTKRIVSFGVLFFDLSNMSYKMQFVSNCSLWVFCPALSAVCFTARSRSSTLTGSPCVWPSVLKNALLASRYRPTAGAADCVARVRLHAQKNNERRAGLRLRQPPPLWRTEHTQTHEI